MKSVVGITVTKSQLVLVRLEMEESNPGNARIVDDRTIPIQSGCRGIAYRRLQEWLSTYLGETKPNAVAVKGSALSGKGAATLGLLEGAEVRGVVMAGVIEAGSHLEVRKKAGVSKTFGERKVDAYVSDDEFWIERFTGELRKGSREAALFAFVVGDGL